MTAGDYIITHMNKREVQDIAIQWAKEEGWNPGLQDAEAFYAQDPQGFFVGCLDGQPISCCSAVIYDESFAFFGLYIVKSEFRQQGYGMQITQKGLQHMANRNIGLDGVLDKCSKYENIGFHFAHLNIRHQGQIRMKEDWDPHVVLISESLIPLVKKFDKLYFPAARSNFLNIWLKQSSDAMSLVYIHENMINGYGVIRRCFNGYKIGPLFAQSFEVAEKIFQALLSQTKGEVFFLDIPAPNLAALKLVKLYNMQPCFKTIRMYTKKAPDINLEHIYGITTFELG